MLIAIRIVFLMHSLTHQSSWALNVPYSMKHSTFECTYYIVSTANLSLGLMNGSG